MPSSCLRSWSLALLAIAGCARAPEDRPWVAALTLSGVHNVDRRALERGLASAPSRRSAVHPFDELELARDRVRVQRYYEQRGYYAAKVVLAEARPRPDGRAVDVVIAVEEGAPTLIGDVRIMGLGDVDEVTQQQAHKAQLGLRRGQVFHHADYEQFKSSLLRLLREHGFPNAKVAGLVDVRPQDNLASITVTVDPSGETVAPRLDNAKPGGAADALPAAEKKP